MRAVRLSGRLVPALSRRVRTFHVPKVTVVTEVVFFFSSFGSTSMGPRQLQYAGQGEVRQAIFRVPFLSPSPGYGGSSAVLIRAASTLRWLPNSSAVPFTGR